MYLRMYTSPTGWAIFLDYDWGGVIETRRKPWESPRRRRIHGLFVEGPKQFVPATLDRLPHMQASVYNITHSNNLPTQCPIASEDRALVAQAADSIRARFSNDPETKTPPWTTKATKI